MSKEKRDFVNISREKFKEYAKFEETNLFNKNMIGALKLENSGLRTGIKFLEDENKTFKKLIRDIFETSVNAKKDFGELYERFERITKREF